MPEKISKLKKTDVDYGRGMPHCGACRHFIDDEEAEGEGSDEESGSCELVAGKIGEDDWCKLFKEKGGRTLAGGSAPRAR